MTRITLIGIMLALSPGGLLAQSAADSAAIRRAALDYIGGWYEADAARMERAVHPRLAKRLVRHDTGDLAETTAPALVAATGRGDGSRTPPAERRTDVQILDIYENAASVRVTAHEWVDYMHVAKVDGEWQILNVLWELSPEGKERMERFGRRRRPSG